MDEIAKWTKFAADVAPSVVDLVSRLFRDTGGDSEKAVRFLQHYGDQWEAAKQAFAHDVSQLDD